MTIEGAEENVIMVVSSGQPDETMVASREQDIYIIDTDPKVVVGTSGPQGPEGPPGPESPHGIVISMEATQKPNAGAVYDIILPYTLSIPAGLSGSKATCRTNPTAEATATVALNGTGIGAFTVGTDGADTWSGDGADCVAGDVITVSFPSTQDATWAGVSLMIKGG